MGFMMIQVMFQFFFLMTDITPTIFWYARQLREDIYVKYCTSCCILTEDGFDYRELSKKTFGSSL
jgi:hypothetical protein